MAPLRLLMLNYEFPPIGGGGGQAHLALLNQYANRPDLSVEVLTSGPTPGVLREELAPNVTICRIGIHKENPHCWRRREVIEWLIKAGPAYRRLVKTGNFDVAHAFFGFPTGWLCWRTAKRLPYVISLRGSDVPGDNARLKREYAILGPLVFKPIWRKAAALVACSEGLKARALRFMPSAQIEVIPNGVDLTRFHPSADAPAVGALQLLTVGRLSVTKRLPILIGAVDLLGDGGDVHLTIVGGGALEAELRRLLTARQSRGTVTLTGWRHGPLMPDIYRKHDILVSASMQEGMSNAMLEAMACGLPIVTTRCEGVDELVGDNGIVVDEPRPEAIAEAIRSLAENPDLLKRMRTAAVARAAGFTWQATAEKYIARYSEILNRPGGTAR